MKVMLQFQGLSAPSNDVNLESDAHLLPALVIRHHEPHPEVGLDILAENQISLTNIEWFSEQSPRPQVETCACRSLSKARSSSRASVPIEIFVSSKSQRFSLLDF